MPVIDPGQTATTRFHIEDGRWSVVRSRRHRARMLGHRVRVRAREPSMFHRPQRIVFRGSPRALSTSGETLTIEESMNLEGENGARRDVGTSTNGAGAADEAAAGRGPASRRRAGIRGRRALASAGCLTPSWSSGRSGGGSRRSTSCGSCARPTRARGRVRSARCCAARGLYTSHLTTGASSGTPARWRRWAARGGASRPTGAMGVEIGVRRRRRARRGRASEGAQGDRGPGKRLCALGADARTEGASGSTER